MPASEALFIDTNVVLYALGTEEPKRTIAQYALNRFPTISVQVLSEARAALESHCTTLYTEDLQHGQIIDQQLTIINPFSPH